MIYGITTLHVIKKIDKNATLFHMKPNINKYHSHDTILYKMNKNNLWITQDCIVCKWSMLNVNNEKNDKDNQNIYNADLLYPLCYFLYENYNQFNDMMKKKKIKMIN